MRSSDGFRCFSTAIRRVVFGPLLLLYLLGCPKVTQGQITSLRPFNKVRALVVGVSEYRHEKVADLRYAANDARYFAEMLSNQEEWKVEPQDIALLTNEKATFGNFLAELNKLTEVTEARDRVILFFAGHGNVEVVSEADRGYLLFHDVSQNNYAAGGACEVNTLDSAISKLVLEKKGQVILIADACRSGNLVSGQREGQTATAAVIKTLFSNTSKILSCEPNELSREDPDLGEGHGLFSYYLVQGLKGAANVDKNNFVTLLELERYLQDRVLQASGGKQTPTTAGPKSVKLARTRPDNLAAAPAGPAPGAAPPNDPIPTQDATTQLLAFTQAVGAQRLLPPGEASAYAIYESTETTPATQAIKQIMKTTLIGELQRDPQRAILEYLNTPGKELAKRWADDEVYATYPAYLDAAAELMGEGDAFFGKLKSQAHYFRGVNQRLRFERGDQDSLLLESAAREQEAALRLLGRGDAAHVYNEIGLIQLKRSQYRAARESFQLAHEQSPRWGLALTNLAVTHKYMEDFIQAEASYQKAIEADPDLSLTYYSLGILYEEMDRDDDAIRAYESALARPDPVDEATFNLSRLYSRIPGKYEDAVRLMEGYLRTQPEDVYGYLLLGRVYAKLDRVAEAKETYDIALALAPDNYHALLYSAYLADQRGEFSSAIEFWQKTISANPDRKNNQLYLARAYYRAGDRDQALATLGNLLASGYDNLDRLNPEKNFPDLVDDPGFIALIRKYFPDWK